MAILFRKGILLHFFKSCSTSYAFRSVHSRTFFSCSCLRWPQVKWELHKLYHDPSLQHSSTRVEPEKISWECSSSEALLKKLEFALMDHQVGEAWEAFSDYKTLFGFPEHSLLRRLITELCYSPDPQWIQKASDLVFLILDGKSNLLERNSLTKLSLSLARTQMPVPASEILWLMLEKKLLPPMKVLSSIFMHMVKSEVGSYLTSNFLVEICDSFLCLNRLNRAKHLKPDTMTFNLVLDACVRYGLSLKGQQIIELMARVGVVGDAHTIVMIAQIHEMNGQRDEIKKFKCYVDGVSVPFVRHYRQFYDSLLSLQFKFNDVDSASGLALDICKCPETLPTRKDRMDVHKPCVVPIGSQYLRRGLKIEIAPELLQRDSVLKAETKQELVMFENGKLLLTTRALAKLMNLYKSSGRITKLSKFVISIQKESFPLQQVNLCSDVIDACICVDWLEVAHDILDDMELEGLPMDITTYMSLIRAYCKGNMFKEAIALLKQMRKAGFLIDMSDEMLISRCVSEVVDKSTTDLAGCLLWEMKEQIEVPPVVYELNSSIYFFCKAKMIEDALRTYRRMHEARIIPTVQTFANLVFGYSSWEMYREITVLWGDIKRNLENGNEVLNRDLLEFLLLNFLRGGYFERVMEVIDYMRERGMYTDKRMYRSQFLKLHKDLYRNLRASEARTEAQSKRLEFVRTFRKWVGIDYGKHAYRKRV